MSRPSSATASGLRSGWWLATLAGVVLVAGLMFRGSFVPENIHFSSDGPLGASSAAAYAFPGVFTGVWQDLNWVGAWGGNVPPSLTNLLLWMLGPVGFAKFYAPISILLVGLAASLLFRQLGFRPWIGLLGALAAALNTDFFSYACWGLGTLTLCMAWGFVALAALVTPGTKQAWLRAVVAGFAVGMAILEGLDSGAILSLYIAAFVVFQTVQAGPTQVRAWGVGVLRVGVVAVVAALVATAALSMLISTQIKGVVGMDQDNRTKSQRWEDATQWSLPKLETTRIIIPGLFGYRMDTPDGGNYWGRVGERTGYLARHSGSGVYAGLAVVVLAVWGMAQAGRGRQGPFTEDQRRAVWFWTGAALLSLGFAWGKHAPLYQFLYALPYFSTIRNPIKFIHPFSLSIVVLMGYGLYALGQLYLAKAGAATSASIASLRAWWANAAPFDRKWCAGSMLALGAALLAWLLYSASRGDLEAHLKTAVGPELAPLVAQYSLGEFGLFVLFLLMTLAVLGLMVTGVLGGRRARWGAVALGLIVVADLMRANAPWVFYWNYREKYATNALVEALRTKPYDQRVGMPYGVVKVLMENLPQTAAQQLGVLHQVYHGEWLQHQFQYYNVQSIDLIQEPRTSVENKRYRDALDQQQGPRMLRQLQLTSTRYVLGIAGPGVEALNAALDPTARRFRERMAFTIGQERAGGPILVQTNATGPFALVEFTGALPRAKMYSQWRVSTDDEEVLQQLANPGFDPATSVLVSGPAPDLAPAPGTNAPAGSVEVLGYRPKEIRLRTQAAAPSVLLWNDKYDPQWRVTIDGKPGAVLRCNFLMRGVAVPAGEHTVEFQFRTAIQPLVVSLIGIGAGLLLALGLFRVRPETTALTAVDASGPAPARTVPRAGASTSGRRA